MSPIPCTSGILAAILSAAAGLILGWDSIDVLLQTARDLADGDYRAFYRGPAQQDARDWKEKRKKYGVRKKIVTALGLAILVLAIIFSITQSCL